MDRMQSRVDAGNGNFENIVQKRSGSCPEVCPGIFRFFFLPMYISEKSGDTIFAKKEIAGWRRLPC